MFITYTQRQGLKCWQTVILELFMRKKVIERFTDLGGQVKNNQLPGAILVSRGKLISMLR